MILTPHTDTDREAQRPKQRQSQSQSQSQSQPCSLSLCGGELYVVSSEWVVLAVPGATSPRGIVWLVSHSIGPLDKLWSHSPSFCVHQLLAIYVHYQIDDETRSWSYPNAYEAENTLDGR